MISSEEYSEEIKRALTLPAIPLSARESGDLMMLGLGGFTPLKGFMHYDDWKSVCEQMCLSNGLFWPIPITLSVRHTIPKRVRHGEEYALIEEKSGVILGTIQVEDKYIVNHYYECKHVFGTIDPNHPGVNMVNKQGGWSIGGPVKVFQHDYYRKQFPNIYKTPQETRTLFQIKGWETIAAFQTRNPMHRAHEHLVRVALKICDGVLIHSLLGQLKPGDIPASVRVKAITALIEHHLIKDSVIQGGYPLAMRYAGPREALLHALFRQNYGCTHIIIGRDHAGVANFYEPYAAQNIFDQIPQDALKIKPIKINRAFWCKRCNSMMTDKECPHDTSAWLNLSGTALREMLSKNQEIPENFSRPEVLNILKDFYQTQI